jgi:hypothetical protein
MLIKDHGMSSPVGIDAGTTLWKLVSGTSDFEMKVVPAGEKDCNGSEALRRF